ncbi:aminoglycoside phosphotransferase [Beutenbergia cavernae DSM 12333]|uniref:Aminoglycoside phosphotransferase n=1 Tax=Beutenbergia cavernae (strain ATCC BAA-8 / DSM 12333 / CCUG 43141 / JCM 11478 / NBRC 16432 / NCIMB 13614 / HKI 0122) TaxID=471853 RepID=C5BUZ6_BEUC1|nr:phosphotransferase [Beutenbergia cavernae]ACQ78370.1 aminoglycoside phosphotransferase [Beutenbergia cavernae DSM 12333]
MSGGAGRLASAANLLGRGRTADVYDLGDGLVLRRYRDGYDAEREAEIQAHVAEHGFPAPAVVEAHGPDLVMARVAGPTMLGALVAGDARPDEAAHLLADLHDRLHALPAPAGPREPGDVVVHLDLHPDNVMLDPERGPVLIDWANARLGTADLDVAMTALILAEVAVAPPDSELAAQAGPALAAVPALGAAFLAAVDGDARLGLAGALAMRAANPTLDAAEKERLSTAVRAVREWADAAG